jgi:hypothetical protein
MTIQLSEVEPIQKMSGIGVIVPVYGDEASVRWVLNRKIQALRDWWSLVSPLILLFLGVKK